MESKWKHSGGNRTTWNHEIDNTRVIIQIPCEAELRFLRLNSQHLGNMYSISFCCIRWPATFCLLDTSSPLIHFPITSEEQQFLGVRHCHQFNHCDWYTQSLKNSLLPKYIWFSTETPYKMDIQEFLVMDLLT